MFRLLRFFSITSVAAIIVVVVMMGMFWQNQVNQLIGFAERQNVELARSFANTIWPRFSTYVKQASEHPSEEIKTSSQTLDIERAVKSIAAGLPVLKVKIYNMNGLTVFSSERAQIGEDKGNNPGFFSAAQRGEPASKLTFRDTFSTFSGAVPKRDLVESYIPIRRGSGPVEGVFELYTDVTPHLANIKRSTLNFLVIFVSIFGILYAVLFLIVKRADGTIKQQYDDITGKNAALEKEITHRQRVEDELIHAHGELEQRVEERTQELTAEISERQRVEEEAHKQRNELARVGGVIIMGEMATSLAHEINQPLTVISGSAQYCVNALRSGEGRPEKLLDSMEQVAEQAGRADEIIRRIRGFMEMGEQEREVIDINETIRNLEDLLQIDAREHGAILELNFDENLFQVVADSVQIQQVLLNLAHNGMEAMKETPASKRKLEIRTSNRNDNEVEISVTDCGEGIPESSLDKVFNPFYSTKSEGLGMGLAISRSIVEAHFGRLSATSDNATGSIFRLVLPAAA